MQGVRDLAPSDLKTDCQRRSSRDLSHPSTGHNSVHHCPLSLIVSRTPWTTSHHWSSTDEPAVLTPGRGRTKTQIQKTNNVWTTDHLTPFSTIPLFLRDKTRRKKLLLTNKTHSTLTVSERLHRKGNPGSCFQSRTEVTPQTTKVVEITAVPEKFTKTGH